MKKIFLLLACMGLFLTSCVEGEQQIDETATEAKKLLDEVGGKAGDFLEKNKDKFENSEETVKSLKELIDKVAEKAKEVNQKVEQDTAFRNKLLQTKETLGKDAQDILKDFEKIIEELKDDKPKA